MLFVKAVSCVSVFFTFCWNNIQLLAFIIASWETKKKIFQLSCAVVMTFVFLRICTRMWAGIYSSAPLKLSLQHVFWIIAIYHIKIHIIKDNWYIWTSNLATLAVNVELAACSSDNYEEKKAVALVFIFLNFSTPSFKPKDRYDFVDTFLDVFICYHNSRLFCYLRQIPSPFVM